VDCDAIQFWYTRTNVLTEPTASVLFHEDGFSKYFWKDGYSAYLRDYAMIDLQWSQSYLSPYEPQIRCNLVKTSEKLEDKTVTKILRIENRNESHADGEKTGFNRWVVLVGFMVDSHWYRCVTSNSVLLPRLSFHSCSILIQPSAGCLITDTSEAAVTLRLSCSATRTQKQSGLRQVTEDNTEL
jgi:hypothetical protein